MEILDALYKGELNPHYNYSMSADYKKADLEQNEFYIEFESTLSKEQKKLLEKLWDYKITAEYEYGKQMFKTGFSLALKLATETFCE